MTSRIIEQQPETDEYDREPLSHPALTDVDKLSYRQPQEIVNTAKLARLGLDMGLGEVMRWKPRLVWFPLDFASKKKKPLLTL